METVKCSVCMCMLDPADADRAGGVYYCRRCSPAGVAGTAAARVALPTSQLSLTGRYIAAILVGAVVYYLANLLLISMLIGVLFSTGGPNALYLIWLLAGVIAGVVGALIVNAPDRAKAIWGGVAAVGIMALDQVRGVLFTAGYVAERNSGEWANAYVDSITTRGLMIAVVTVAGGALGGWLVSRKGAS